MRKLQSINEVWNLVKGKELNENDFTDIILFFQNNPNQRAELNKPEKTANIMQNGVVKPTSTDDFSDLDAILRNLAVTKNNLHTPGTNRCIFHYLAGHTLHDPNYEKSYIDFIQKLMDFEIPLDKNNHQHPDVLMRDHNQHTPLDIAQSLPNPNYAFIAAVEAVAKKRFQNMANADVQLNRNNRIRMKSPVEQKLAADITRMHMEVGMFDAMREKVTVTPHASALALPKKAPPAKPIKKVAKPLPPIPPMNAKELFRDFNELIQMTLIEHAGRSDNQKVFLARFDEFLKKHDKHLDVKYVGVTDDPMNGSTILHLLAMHHNKFRTDNSRTVRLDELIKLLIDKFGMNPDIKNANNETVVDFINRYYANDLPRKVELLNAIKFGLEKKPTLAAKPKVNAATLFNYKPTIEQASAYDAKFDAVQKALNSGAIRDENVFRQLIADFEGNVNAQSSQFGKFTLLHLFASFDSEKLPLDHYIKELIGKHGANPFLLTGDMDGTSVFDQVNQKGYARHDEIKRAMDEGMKELMAREHEDGARSAFITSEFKEFTRLSNMAVDKRELFPARMRLSQFYENAKNDPHYARRVSLHLILMCKVLLETKSRKPTYRADAVIAFSQLLKMPSKDEHVILCQKEACEILRKHYRFAQKAGLVSLRDKMEETLGIPKPQSRTSRMYKSIHTKFHDLIPSNKKSEDKKIERIESKIK